uniref:Uncharacterized protein n=1 Tax=Glossina palpalis gambiensis TaxID=67801 RepID=A0A1B0B418_9MUSC
MAAFVIADCVDDNNNEGVSIVVVTIIVLSVVVTDVPLLLAGAVIVFVVFVADVEEKYFIELNRARKLCLYHLQQKPVPQIIGHAKHVLVRTTAISHVQDFSKKHTLLEVMSYATRHLREDEYVV